MGSRDYVSSIDHRTTTSVTYVMRIGRAISYSCDPRICAEARIFAADNAIAVGITATVVLQQRPVRMFCYVDYNESLNLLQHHVFSIEIYLIEYLIKKFFISKICYKSYIYCKIIITISFISNIPEKLFFYTIY